MNIFHGEGIDNCFLNAVTHCSLTLSQILKHINSITVLTKVTLTSEFLHVDKGHGQYDIYNIDHIICVLWLNAVSQTAMSL